MTDERLADGRPADVAAFRRATVAGRLGLDVSLPPQDLDDVADAVRSLSARGGGMRLSPEPIAVPDPEPTACDRDAWNPDGSPRAGFDPMVAHQPHRHVRAWVDRLGGAQRLFRCALTARSPVC